MGREKLLHDPRVSFVPGLSYAWLPGCTGGGGQKSATYKRKHSEHTHKPNINVQCS